VCVASTAGVLLSAANAAAQTSSAETSSEGLFRVGPMAFTPSLSIQDAGIDDNVLSDAAGRRDYTYTIGPQLLASAAVGPVRLKGTGQAGFVYYQKYKDQQSVNGQMSLRVDVVGSQVRPFAEARYSRTRVLSDVDVLTRVRSARPGGMAGLDVQLTPLTALTGWVERAYITYDKREQFLGVPLAVQLDQRTQIMAGGARHYLTPLTTLTTAVEYKQHRFEGNALRDADALRVAPAVEFGSGAVINGRLAAGFQDFKPFNPMLPRLRGLVASATASFTVFGVTRFDVQADRDVDFSFDATQPYYWRTGGRVTVSQRVVGPVDVVAIAERRHVSYQGFTDRTAPAHRDRLVDAGLGMGIRLSQDAQLRVVYDRFARQSDGPVVRTFERRRVMASLALQPK
jgi:hypothetical protein